MTEIQKRLFELCDDEYATFQRRLIPNILPESIIGVRTHELRVFAKEIKDIPEGKRLLNSAPHKYFEENQIHCFILSEFKNFECCISETEKFLPYIDNWATCDMFSPKCFKKNKTVLLPYIKKWIKSEHTYTVRFAAGMLMRYFLDDDFNEDYLYIIADIKSEEYYVNMMIAWYFATALTKQYDSTLPFIIEHKLSSWVHNKTIQKAVESYRITPEQKSFLKTLKINSK